MFSEFAHHFVGSLEVILGLAELGSALQYPLPYWTRFILPGALSMVGWFTLIWSDRDAWPIGFLSFVMTFFGEDREIIEHKSYGILTLTITFLETLRRMGRVRHPAWAAPLVLLVLAGRCCSSFILTRLTRRRRRSSSTTHCWASSVSERPSPKGSRPDCPVPRPR